MTRKIAIVLSLVFIYGFIALLSLDVLVRYRPQFYLVVGDSHSQILFYVGVCLFAAISSAYAAFDVRSQKRRAVSAIGFFMVVLFTFGDPVKNIFIYLLPLYAAVVLACVEKKLDTGMQIVQATLLAMYTMAGLWKILWLVPHCVFAVCEARWATSLFAAQLIETGAQPPWGDFLILHPVVAYAGYCTVAVWQVSELPLYYLTYKKILVPVVTILFHVAIFATLGIGFFPFVIVIHCVYVLPEMLRYEYLKENTKPVL